MSVRDAGRCSRRLPGRARELLNWKLLDLSCSLSKHIEYVMWESYRTFFDGVSDGIEAALSRQSPADRASGRLVVSVPVRRSPPLVGAATHARRAAGPSR